MDQSLKALPHVIRPPSTTLPKQASKLGVRTLVEWEQQRDVFAGLYLDEGLTLARAKEVMAEQYNFYATEAQYKTRIKVWGLEKNLDSKTTSAMLQIERRRKNMQDKSTTFKYKGRSIGEDRMAHLRKKHPDQGEAKHISLATPPNLTYYTPRPDQRTPDAEGFPESNSVLMIDDNLPHSKSTNSTRSPSPDAISSLVEGVRNANLQSTLIDIKLALTSRGGDHVDREGMFGWDVVSGQPSGLQGQESHEIPSLSPMSSSLNCDQLIKVHSSDEHAGGYSLTGASWMSVGAKSVIGSWIQDDVVMSGMSPFDFESSSFRSASYSSENMDQPLATCCGVSLRTPYDMSVHYAEYCTHKNRNHDLGGGRRDRRIKIDELFRAIKRGDERRVRSILEDGVDHSIQSEGGTTALRLAVSKGNKEIVRLLLDNGADPSVPWGGITALHLAVSEGNEEIVQLLLENGANDSVPSRNGITVLHLAASRACEGIIRLLLSNGADFSVLDSDGETALHVAASEGHESMVEILLESGVDKSVQNDSGETALHKAASRGHQSVVEILLEGGVNRFTRNSRGDTALDLALSRAHWGTIKLLRAYGT